ncbi:hypothetical protein [Colwellia sp. E2M01]|uniref:hypothetical protein n=1 Tax=Colwellia sp. E2M01 TaxID=2841561 RepID=UPI001C098BE1|nr:hypothetical protein [Colwellia sp. E2M01]MBU2869906.1 hypothetical protein [Colwellia sp. E2M01]
MTIFKLGITFFIYLTLTACSSTSQVNSAPQSNNYYAKNFSHYEFTHNNANSIKKPATSDQDLLISLLNRPIPEDQRMILAYAERQNNYLPDSTIMGIEIKGDKRQETRTRVSSNYAHVIEQDNNSVKIVSRIK